MNKKFQIFVSSTYSDLKLERQACVEAILTAGHIPAGMELFSAGDESQLEIIKRWIDESDIYMLLLGGRYGSIEPKSGLSYTELEYRYALESGKPYFAVIMSDDFLDQKIKLEGKDVLELSNQHKYESFKQLVLSKISKFFHNKDQLQLSVMQSLLNIQNRHSLTGWVKANESVDSSKVLNQISELTERNNQLEKELENCKRDLSIKKEEGLFEDLSEEAKVLIIQASKDPFCQIVKSRLSDHILLNVNGLEFPQEYTPRSIATWEHAFSLLVKYELIKPTSSTGSDRIYTLKKAGFEIADILNNSTE